MSARSMVVHGYLEGCGFNATIPGTDLWRDRRPMNAYELRGWVDAQKPDSITYTGDEAAARKALAGSGEYS